MKKHTWILVAAVAAGCFGMASTGYAAQSPSDTPACSVHLFDGSHFKDDNIVIEGPGEFADLKNLPGANGKSWNDEADSLKVGSDATVTAWEKKNFKGEKATYKPGSEHPGIEEPTSLKIDC